MLFNKTLLWRTKVIFFAFHFMCVQIYSKNTTVLGKNKDKKDFV